MFKVKRYGLHIFALSLITPIEEHETLNNIQSVSQIAVLKEPLYKFLSFLDTPQLNKALLKILGDPMKIVELDERGIVFVDKKYICNLIEYMEVV